MPVHKMTFVLVNNMAPRNASVCAKCSRPLDGATCTIFPPRGAIAGSSATPWVSGFAGSVATTNPFELAVAWPLLTFDVASALFDSAWSDPWRLMLKTHSI